MAKIPDISDKVIIIIGAVGVASLLLSFLISSNTKPFPESLVSEEVTESYTAIEGTLPPPTAMTSSFDLGAATQERILGDPRAPIKISEHSSLTCGHCGSFHKAVFEKFKAAYIDTGKAYLVFSDFPLNAPALHASKVARCVPQERYFEFIEALFQNQDDWAFEQNYMAYLKDKAAEFGVDAPLFQACVESKDLEAALVERIQAVQSQWGVNSTPSFVINNQKTISGSGTFAAFDEAIQKALLDIEQEAEAPAPETPDSTEGK